MLLLSQHERHRADRAETKLQNSVVARAEMAEGRPTGRVWARVGDDPSERLLVDLGSPVVDVAVADLTGHGEKIVVIGTQPSDGRGCLFRIPLDGGEIRSLDLTDRRDWPDCRERPIWSCEAVVAHNLDNVPGDELIVIASSMYEYPTRVSVIDPRKWEVRSTFWHFGRLSRLLVAPSFFGAGRDAIVLWGMNNKLDGFERPQPDDAGPLTQHDIVSVVLILDPQRMDGLGPPRTNRLPGLDPAYVYAYAFLDRAAGGWMGTDDPIQPPTHPDPRKRVAVTGVDCPPTSDGALPCSLILVNVNNLAPDYPGSACVTRTLEYDHSLIAHPSEEVEQFWRGYWKPLIHDGQYLMQ